MEHRRQQGGNEATPWSLIALLFLFVLIPNREVLFGTRLLFLRDLGTTHLPIFSIFHRIGINKINPYASFGQPLAGNPNLLAYYPFPKRPEFAAAFVLLHLLMAYAGCRRLLACLGVSLEAQRFAATIFAGSGYVLSMCTSLNAIATIAYVPWLVATGEQPPSSWRGRAVAIALWSLAFLAGEPVLLMLTLALAFGVALRRSGHTKNVALAVGAAFALTFPIHVQTWHAAQESFRLVHGFDYAAATTGSFHPVRLLEILHPFLFGSPSRIGPGSWWGYRLSSDAAPYVYTCSLAPLAICFALFAPSKLRDVWFWRGVLLLSGAAAACPYWLPEAERMFTHLPFLHVVRFPVKFLLPATLAVAVLAAYGLDAWLIERHRWSRISLAVTISAAVLFLAAVGVWVWPAATCEVLSGSFWDVRAAVTPEEALRPTIRSLPLWMAFAAFSLAAVSALWTYAGTRTAATVFSVTVLVHAIATSRGLFPSIPATEYTSPSPIVAGALRLRGRIYERVAKDIDGVAHGLFGRYPSNDSSYLGISQARQGWALAGARFGVRYAYDSSPDASYFWRTEEVRLLVDSLPWDRRVKWLRSVSVEGIVTSRDLRDVPGVHALVAEADLGAPVALYAVDNPLPEARRLSCIAIAPSISATVPLVTSPGFDEQRCAVISMALPGVTAHASDGSSLILRDEPDHIIAFTTGKNRDILVLARNYSEHAAVRVNSHPQTAFPVNGHLIGIVVPVGRTIVDIRF